MTLSHDTTNLLAERYRVIGRLGRGGMAVVMLAEDERLGRKVAVKRLHAESPDDAARRFEREAKLGASLNHPNIVAVYDIATDDEGVLIVMEYVDGETLRDTIARGPIPPARAIELLWGIAAALDHAHEHGVVHRDVKPANVLIARDGTVKLTDLGIATAAERTHITHSGTVLGTASYMPPERLDGQPGGPAADVYATAAVAFEMLSGRQTVTGRNAIEIARRVTQMPPPDLAEAQPGTPRRAAEVLKRGLAKDPAERPASAGALVRELSAAYADEVERRPASGRKPVSAAAPRPRPASAAAVLNRVEETGPLPPPLPAAADMPTPARERRPAPPGTSAPARRSRSGWLLPALLAAVLGVVAAIVLLGSGGSDDGAKQASTAPAPQAKKQPGKTAATPATPQAQQPQPQPEQPATPAPPAAAKPSGTPTQALSDFYDRAASHDFDGAWALGTDNLHAQFGGSIDTFRSTLATLQHIAFPTMSTTNQSADSATVAFTSVATHTDHTDRCTGTAQLTTANGQWLVDHLDVQCQSDQGPEQNGKKPKKPKKPKGPKPHN